MEFHFDWESPSCRLVLRGVLDALVEHGYDGLTAADIQRRAGAAGPALGEFPDLDDLVVAALERVRLFQAPVPTGCLREDLQALLQPWRDPRSHDEFVLAAVLSAAEWHPRLKRAVFHVLDRPLAQAVGSILALAQLGR